MGLRLKACAAGVLAFGVGASASAGDWHGFGDRSYGPWGFGEWGGHGWRFDKRFNRIATLPNFANGEELDETTVSEIIAATEDGNTLVYTDSPRDSIGFIDIRHPPHPMPAGTLELDGEPTSVTVLGNDLALVGVNTSESFVEPSGHLAVVDIDARSVVATLDLGGQPDSTALSPDGRHLAVAIENERDEEICVGGGADGMAVPEDDDTAIAACQGAGGAVGIVPQNGPGTDIGNPAGFLAIVDIEGSNPADWAVGTADLTGLANVAPSDPEPEFVDINDANQAVVTLQENNHIAVVDLATRSVVNDFSAGAVSLRRIDATEDDVISLTESLYDLAREPDAAAWVPRKYGADAIATANEGDFVGGSRGFSFFTPTGEVIYDSGSKLEHIAVRHGHYPESRSGNKGTEPEAIEYGGFGRDDYVFVGSERGSFIAVYKLDRLGRPGFEQLLPAPFGPEGVLAIPSRNLLVVSGEEDDPSFGVRSTVMIYELGYSDADYPELVSNDDPSGTPIPWSAMSGMAGIPGTRDEMLGVWDSYYRESRIFRIDASREPARVVEATTITGRRSAETYDPEGIAIAPDGTYWIASEGDDPGMRQNLLVQVDRHGNVLEEIGLPADIEACRLAEADADGSTGTLGSGFEGVAVIEGRGRGSFRRDGGYRLAVVQQRGWDYTTPGCEALDDDPDGSNPGEPGYSRIWIHDPRNGEWGHIAYELETVPAEASWVGLSEITAVSGGYLVIERDNRTGDFASIKTLVHFDAKDARDGAISRDDKRVHDLLPALEDSNGWISDKPEGVAVTRGGRTFLVTDNDGVDDWSGETSFVELGRWWHLFR